MSDTEDKLFDLLDQWSELRQQGKDIDVEELCHDCPELIPELERRIKVLRATDWLDTPISGSADESFKSKPADFNLPTHLGRYKLAELIGEGGFGQVWKGFDPELHRSVAIKLPRPDRVSTKERIEEFLQEARRVAQLKHPGIVPIHDVGQDGKRCFIISDLIEGRNLAEAIDAGKTDARDACRIVAVVARVLQHAHDQGFVHRDIKPSNILLDHEQKVFLTDFGIAATVQELAENQVRNVGTLAYMSPEQISDDGAVDARTDIYSLGTVLFELLTGGRLITESDPAKASDQIERGREANRLNGLSVPGDLKIICRMCLARDREKRFKTPNDLADALESFLNHKSRTGLWSVSAGLICLGLGFAFWPSVEPEDVTQPTQTRTEEQAPAAPVEALTDEETIVITEASQIIEQDSPTSSLLLASGNRLISGTVDGSVVIHSLDGSPSQKLDNASEVTALALSPSGSRLACGCANGLLRLWDMSQSPPIETEALGGHASRIRDVVYNQDETAVVTGGQDRLVQVWNLTVNPLLDAKLPEAKGPVLDLQFIRDELTIGIGSESSAGDLWVWQVDMKEPQLLPIDTKSINGLSGVQDAAFSSDGRFMAAVHDNGRIAGLEFEIHPEHRRRAIRMIGFLERQPEPVTSIAVVPADDFVVAVCRGSTIELWNLRTTTEIARIQESRAIRSFIISGDRQTAVTGTDSHIGIWQLPDDLNWSR